MGIVDEFEAQGISTEGYFYSRPIEARERHTYGEIFKANKELSDCGVNARIGPDVTLSGNPKCRSKELFSVALYLPREQIALQTDGDGRYELSFNETWAKMWAHMYDLFR